MSDEPVGLGEQWVVLTGSDAAALLQEAQTLDTWTPPVSVIAEIEPVLHAVLQPLFDARDSMLAALHVTARTRIATDYFVQCVGVVRDRRRLVYLNGFHRDTIRFDRHSWRTTPVLAMDGGQLFFQALYDPETRQVTDLRFNGPYGRPNPHRP